MTRMFIVYIDGVPRAAVTAASADAAVKAADAVAKAEGPQVKVTAKDAALVPQDVNTVARIMELYLLAQHPMFNSQKIVAPPPRLIS